MSTNQPPPDVAKAAAVVQQWLDTQEATPPAPTESATERFIRTIRPDVPAEMPRWRDPRADEPSRFGKR
jgi:hypothetical protein